MADDLKESMSMQSRMCMDKKFHREEPAMVKALSL